MLGGDVYDVVWNQGESDFLKSVTDNSRKIDCLLLEQSSSLIPLFSELEARNILLPVVIITHNQAGDSQPGFLSSLNESLSAQVLANDRIVDEQGIYHTAVVYLGENSLDEVDRFIHQAIDHFLQLPVLRKTDDLESMSGSDDTQDMPVSGLAIQQKRLSEKLKERLGYLGVYYKRSPQNFFKNMSRAEKHRFLEKLSADYREIILGYFSKDATLNQKIDSYVNAAFFADIAVAQIVEIHMDLMDDFSKQLQLEGRSEDILLDYRLTLIDVIAHLCEMYRRSIPRRTDV